MKIKTFLKNNIIYIIYIFVILTILFFIYKNFVLVDDFKENQKVENVIQTEKIIKEKTNKDSDNDGLFDWQEVLYGTDKYLPDSDGDGMNDGQEVSLGRSPLIDGVGVASDIEEIKMTGENILTLQKQKKQWDKVYKRQEEIERQIQKISKIGNKSQEDLQFLQDSLKNKKLIKDDLNKWGLILSNNFYKVENVDDKFNNLFLFFFPDNDQLLKEYPKNGMGKKPDLKDYRKLTDSELGQLDKLADSYLKTADILKQEKFSDLDVKLFKNNFEKAYRDMGVSIKEMTVLVKKGDRKVEAQDTIMKYISGIQSETRQRTNLNEIISIYNIKFSDLEPGKQFVYSI